ncbi:leucyl/phenylalanyl-tRNA--protein transferase [Roseovarius sp. EL26]|uniref:leucyl/phenylalanyl-tRNA--protein transferase n=1 Tax=Roseovarius sp. EL26 TaxID=2126672 RepID=UPI0015751749|nr:leucyl/phenylalanyl-tRNA--protein transferase [Roseovarius sp. EL26]
MTKIPNEITPELLLRAYASGIFPMAEGQDNPEIFWVDPQHRGILPLDGFHISRSLARRMRKGDYTASWNTDFSGVLDGCADRSQTWINDEIRGLYTALHRKGFAHSLEISASGRLVGGVYGVALGSAFFGESMFSRQTDASKLALAHLCDHLRRCRFTLCDTQFLTDHLASLGAIEIPRDDYRKLLAQALGQSTALDSVAFESASDAVLHRMTQTS